MGFSLVLVWRSGEEGEKFGSRKAIASLLFFNSPSHVENFIERGKGFGVLEREGMIF